MKQRKYRVARMVEFNYIRNRIRKFSKESLVMSSLKILRNSEKSNIIRIPLWDILLIIKWTLIYAEQNRYPKTATTQDIQFLIDKINELRNQHKLYIRNHTIDLKKVLSLTIYHQAYFQFSVWEDSFSRQLQLYTKHNISYNIDNEFEKFSGLSIIQFIRLSFLLWCYTSPDRINSKNKSYNGLIRDDFIEIAKKFEKEAIVNKYINLLSIEYSNAEEVISRNNQIKSPVLQTFEISIFAKLPILLFNGSRVIFHKRLLNYTINHFVYDYLKEHDSERFSTEFGERFEKYVELGINEMAVNYKTETQLKKFLTSRSKVVDFIIEEDILIECKAIELKPYPSVFPDNEVIYNWLETSIVKAYAQQMMSVANNFNPLKEKFGIILTYKETYFGNGEDAWNTFLKTPTEEYATKENLDINILPPKNLFFIDIATWDRIVLIIKSGETTLKELLLKAIRDNEKGETRKFSFHMHLEDYKIGPFNLSYLDKIDEIVDFNKFSE